MRSFINIFKALSDPNRVRILKMLEFRPLCVCEITYILNMATSTVSKHLSILRDAGFILDQKEGKWVEYKLNKNSSNVEVKQQLSLLPGWLNDDEVIKTYKKRVTEVDRNIICKT
ncbi:MAG: metalloregulator ArsR/SmtB family transcription factor [FCB group bacterium]|jgi:ArsR family transcriptional regulator